LNAGQQLQEILFIYLALKKKEKKSHRNKLNSVLILVAVVMM